MRTRLTYGFLRGALFVVALGLTACVNTLELATPVGNGGQSIDQQKIVADAQAYFNAHGTQLSRSAEATPTEEAPFVVGNLVPDWDSAVTIANEEKVHTDFAMRKDYDFYWLPDGDVERSVKLYSRFASVEEFALDTMSQYVATYIPDEEYLRSYPAVAQDYGINCAELYEFSGVVLYTMLSGHHVAAYRYECGELTERAFLYDKEKTPEENIDDFYGVMNGITIGIAEAEQTTRAIPNIVWVDPETRKMYVLVYLGDYYVRPDFEYSVLPDDYTIVEPITNNRDVFVAVGGGSGNTTTEEKLTAEKFTKKILKNTLNPTDSVQLSSMLSEIIEDCMGKMLLQEIYDKGTQISITFNPNAKNSKYTFADRVDPITNKITQTENYSITLTSYQDFVLLHELFHFYQHQRLGSAKFKSAKSNYEVEAYLATYMYMEHSGSKTINSTGIWEYIEVCAALFDPNSFGGENSKESEYLVTLFGYYFHDAAMWFHKRNPMCPYDKTQTPTDNIRNIQKLMQHCQY